MSSKKSKLGIVIRFDENLGIGFIKIKETGEILRITYRDIDEEGFKVLFEGELVTIDERGRIRRVIDEM